MLAATSPLHGVFALGGNPVSFRSMFGRWWIAIVLLSCAPGAGQPCVPACRTGFVCAQGACVSACNPSCAANETCSATGECFARTTDAGPDVRSGLDASIDGPSIDSATDDGTIADGSSVCVPTPITGAFTANGLRNLTINRGTSVTYALPLYPSAGTTIELLSIQSTSSQSDLTSEFSVSTCPGAFDGVPPECKAWGIVNQSGTQLRATTAAAPVAGMCTMSIGTQYYVSVRNVQFDRVTPSCTPSTCYMILQLNSY